MADSDMENKGMLVKAISLFPTLDKAKQALKNYFRDNVEVSGMIIGMKDECRGMPVIVDLNAMPNDFRNHWKVNINEYLYNKKIVIDEVGKISR